MKIFMLGWEYPPFISGGLGTACYGLTRALDHLGHRIIFVLPRALPAGAANAQQWTQNAETTFAYFVSRDPNLANVEVRAIPAVLRPYDRPDNGGESAEPSDIFSAVQEAPVDSATTRGAPPPHRGPTSILHHPAPTGVPPGPYGGDMFAEVHRYARTAMRMAIGETFDVIHAHDWMTYPAGIAVAAVTGKPLVVHVHSTEFDRSGEQVNQTIYDIERHGMQSARKVIAVSHLTRNIVVNRYGVPSHKVEVVYNAIDLNGEKKADLPPIRRDEKIVLFLGRITMQKGPDYFLAAARKVLDHYADVRFIMAGSGDMIRRSIEMAAEMGIGHKVLFTGFLRGDDVDRVFKMADLYVMPSVSEPFGITPLEALSHDVPVLISKQSGVSEVLTHVLKVDFWDIHEMANKILAVLQHPPLQATLRAHGGIEVHGLTWRDSALGCLEVYARAATPLN